MLCATCQAKEAKLAKEREKFNRKAPVKKASKLEGQKLSAVNQLNQIFGNEDQAGLEAVEKALR